MTIVDDVLKDMREMANLPPDKTGLPAIVWVDDDLANLFHGPRIKVFRSGENFSVSISDNPQVEAGKCFLDSQDLKKVCSWIIKNKEALLDFGYQRISQPKLMDILQKV